MVKRKLKLGDQVQHTLHATIQKWFPSLTEHYANSMLIHELRVHQIELEAQNLELRESQLQLVEANHRYQHLYELAPVGYATLDGNGVIQDLNLAFADYFNSNRQTLLQRPFFTLLEPGEARKFLAHLRSVFVRKKEQTVELRIKGGDQNKSIILLRSIADTEKSETLKTCRTAVIDITHQRLAATALLKQQEALEGKVKERTAELTHAVESLSLQITERERAQRRVTESEEKYRLLFSYEGDAIFLYDANTLQIVDANAAAMALYGYSLEEFRENTMASLAATVPTTEHLSLYTPADTPLNLPMMWHQSKTGQRFPVELSISTFHWMERNLACAISHSVNERYLSEAKLKLSADVFECTNEAIVVSDSHHAIVMINNAFTKLTGYTTAESLGRDARAILTNHPQENSLLSDCVNLECANLECVPRECATLDDRPPSQREVTHRRKDGTQYTAWENLSAVQDASGRVSHYIHVFSDITRLKNNEKNLSHLAHHDTLTGLPNRLLFSARLEHSLQIARRNEFNVGLLFLDLDRFKFVNDSLGHMLGDELLKEVARRLRSCVRAEDTVARLGGDEFTILLSEIHNEEEIALLAKKILGIIMQPIDVGGRSLVVSTSIGISVFPRDAATAEDLIKAADSAMYSAKDQGRHTYQFYSKELTVRSEERLNLEQDIRSNLANGNFLLYYQPQINLNSGEVIGTEALLRWLLPQGGYSSTQRVISVAEESALIMEIDEWSLRTACAQIAFWRKIGIPSVKTAINVSAMNLIRDHFCDKVKRVLEEFHLPASCLEIEVTEGVLQSGQQVIAELVKLKKLGVTLAIDDFGTGYSSLSSLKNLPIDRIKIDRSFVQDLPNNKNDRGIIQAIITMGHNLDMKVIAEGVENDQQRDFLRMAGCDEVQGYRYSKPLAAAMIPNFLGKKGLLEIVAL